MIKAVQPPASETTGWGHPTWYHHHGDKMRVEKLDLQMPTLILSGSAARVVIGKEPSLNPKGWFVQWEVILYKLSEEGAHGRVYFEEKHIIAAFGLATHSGNSHDWLAKRYGADSAIQGKYIRWKTFLNIPCPGTGLDGDPNVSVRLDEEIKDAVRKLLES